MSRAALIALLLPLAVCAQEVRVTLLGEGGGNTQRPAVLGTVAVPASSDAAALRAASAMRFWVPWNSGVTGALIIPHGADGEPLTAEEQR